MKIFNFLILLFGAVIVANAQQQAATFGAKADNFASRINDVACDVPRTVDKKTAETIKALIRKSLTEYYKLAHFWDPNQDYAVTQESVTRFNELFDDNTKVLSDIAKYNGIVISSENYSSSILDYLTAVGVNFEITSAVVDKIREDKAGYYKVEIFVNKVLYNGLDNDNSQFTCKSGRKFDLIVNYRIDKEDLTKAYISNISGNLIKDCEDAKPKWGYYGGADFGLPTATTSDFFNEKMSGLQLEMKPVITAAFGAYYLKPLSLKDKTFLNVGIQIGYANIRSSIDSVGEYTQKTVRHAFNALDTTFYKTFDRRVVLEKQFVESNHAFNVSIPLGIRHVLHTNNNETFRLSIDAMVTTTLHLTSLTSWSGRHSYYGDFEFVDGNKGTIASEKEELRIELGKEVKGGGILEPSFGLRKNVYFQNLDKEDNVTSVKATKPTVAKLKFHPTFVVSVAPVMEFILNSKMSVTVAPSVGYTLNSYIKSNDSQRFLFMGNPTVDGGYQDRIENGSTSTVAEDYFSSVKLLTFGVRVGLLYQLK